MVQKWRQLAAEGEDYGNIAKATDFDRRTIRKYLEADIRSTGAEQIRRELFKERLGAHWDMLIEGVAAVLVGGLRSVRPDEDVEFVQGAGDKQFSVGEARVSRNANGDFTVTVKARESRAWTLLLQHLPRSPLWPAVAAWEQAIANELRERRSLYQEVERQLRTATKLPILERREGNRQCVLRACVHGLHQTSLSEALRLEAAAWPGDNLKEEPVGLITFQSTTYYAIWPGKKDQLQKILTDAVQVLSASRPAERASEAYDDGRKAAAAIHAALTDLRLLRFLPRACDVCRAIEV